MFSKGPTTLKFNKKSNLFKNSTGSVTCDLTKLEAHSYKWWKFLAVIEGKVVFNDFRYSVSTSKHQNAVRELLHANGIKIDLFLPVEGGLKSHQSLAELILQAEERLCDEISWDVIKKQEQYARTKARKLKAKLEAYLDDSVCFRDYEIKPARMFGNINAIAVHQVVEAKTLENDVQNALHSFSRDGFGQVIFYVEGI